MNHSRLSVLMILGTVLCGSAAQAQYRTEVRSTPGYSSKRVTHSVKGTGSIGGSSTVELMKEMERNKNAGAVVRDNDYYAARYEEKMRPVRQAQQAKYHRWLNSQAAVCAGYIEHKKYKEALELAHDLAQRNCGYGMYAIGTMYFTGQGLKKDYKSALAWYQTAATSGNDKLGKYMLGSMYLNGWGVAKDSAKARDWFQKSDSAESLYALGVMYKEGLGVPKDPEKAFSYFKRAEFAGSAEGAGAMGEAYLLGQGVEQNAEQAKTWLEKAAKMNDAKGEFYLGEMYKRGLSVEKDPSVAQGHYQQWQLLANKAKSTKLSYGLLEKTEFEKLNQRMHAEDKAPTSTEPSITAPEPTPKSN